jgi:hypothetical protein
MTGRIEGFVHDQKSGGKGSSDLHIPKSTLSDPLHRIIERSVRKRGFEGLRPDVHGALRTFARSTNKLAIPRNIIKRFNSF